MTPEALEPEVDAAVSAALDRVEAGGEAWLAGWRERLEASCSREGNRSGSA